jgi:hypothetical protein
MRAARTGAEPRGRTVSAALRLCGIVLALACVAPAASRPPSGALALTVEGDEVSCVASPVSLDERPRLHAITPAGHASRRAPGLTLVLRGTDQLEDYPEAKAAFLRAAAAWERAIALTPITVVVDVDYGPKYFGQSFPSNVLGYTDAQVLYLATNYVFVRNHLLAEASNDSERDLYDRLPPREVPTDLGSTPAIYAPSAAFRAVRFLGPVAKPKADLERGLGRPPAVAISSAFAFDFDPTDGIDASARDFEAVAMHEIGHVLGFTSTVGSRELSAAFPVAVSILDLFRVRPGESLESFTTARRIQSSGGEQVLFAGTRALPLSTGRQDATGGDGRQASHWKDEALGGEFVGLMHPALRPGVHETLTEYDLLAFDLMGYTLAPTGPPIVVALAASIAGDAVRLEGTLAEAGRAARSARIAVLDADYRQVSETAPFAVDFGSSDEFTLEAPGMGLLAQALVARLTLFDAEGREIGRATADYGAADPGGAALKRAKYRTGVLTIKGSGLAEPFAVEVNGAAVSGVPTELVGSKRIELRAGAGRLGLRPGFNRVRVVAGGLRSNIVVVELE